MSDILLVLASTALFALALVYVTAPESEEDP
jgi:hypothetical protein